MLKLSISIASSAEKTEQSCLFIYYKNKMSHTMTPFKINKNKQKSQYKFYVYNKNLRCQNY
jgi:hypothetical protein